MIGTQAARAVIVAWLVCVAVPAHAQAQAASQTSEAPPGQPRLLSASPARFGAGATVVLQGEHLQPDDVVYLGWTKLQHDAPSGDTVTVAIPSRQRRGGDFIVKRRRRIVARLSEVTFVPAPMVRTARPSFATPGETVVLRGRNLEPVETVTLGGKPLTIVERKSTQLTVQVPSDAETGPLVVKSIGGEDRLRRDYEVFRPPLLTAAEPMAGFAGDEVVVTGERLDARRARFMLGRRRLRVKDVQAGRFTFEVPRNARSGELSVTVRGKRVALTPAFEVWETPSITVVPRTFGSPGEFSIRGRDLDGAEAFLLGPHTLDVVSGDGERGRVRRLRLSATDELSAPVRVRMHGREFASRREVQVLRAPVIEGARYVVDGRMVRYELAGLGLAAVRTVRVGGRRYRARQLDDGVVAVRVRGGAPEADVTLVASARHGDSPPYVLRAGTEGYGLSLAEAKRALPKPRAQYTPAQMRLDMAQLQGQLQALEAPPPKRARGAALPTPAERTKARAVAIARAVVRLGAMKHALCVQMAPGKEAAQKNVPLGQLLTEISATQARLLDESLRPLLRGVAPAEMAGGAAAYGVPEVDRELQALVDAHRAMDATCRDRRFGERNVARASQTADIHIEARRKALLETVLGDAIASQSQEKRRAALQKVLEGFSAPRRAEVSKLLEGRAGLAQGGGEVVGKGAPGRKRATKAEPDKQRHLGKGADRKPKRPKKSKAKGKSSVTAADKHDAKGADDEKRKKKKQGKKGKQRRKKPRSKQQKGAS